MSPARSHVEQSRNTLLFASCAKEVTTNAQVNVAISDKALVKHLQRELARLESELRYPRACIFPSDYEALLQEKDLQIQQVTHFDDDKKYLQIGTSFLCDIRLFYRETLACFLLTPKEVTNVSLTQQFLQ